MVRKRGKRKRNSHASKNRGNNFSSIITRYLILIVVALFNLWLFYAIFTPLTVYPVYWILSIFYETTLLARDVILLNRTLPIELIRACIAGAAYYLLLILNLSTPGMKTKTRIKAIVFSFVAFLVINILRIFILSLVALSGSYLFDITHQLFWYALSTVFVVGIWFVEVKLFKIKEIPFYSDIRFLYNQSRKQRVER